MADLISPPNYAAQIAQAAAIPGNQAEQWSGANIQNQQAAYAQQQAQQLAIQNYVNKLTLPLVQRGIQQAGQQMGGNTPNGPSSNQAASPTFNMYGDENEPQPTAYQDAPQEADGPGTANGQAPQAEVDRDRARLDSWSQNEFAPGPLQMDDPTNQRWQSYNSLASTNPIFKQLADSTKEGFENHAENANQQKIIKANQAYNVALAVATSQDPKNTLRYMSPDLYQALDGRDLSEEQLRAAAVHFGATTFPYSGRPFTIENGYPIDTKSSQPVLGSRQIGMSENDRAKISEDWNTPTNTVINGTPTTVPKWQLPQYGFSSNEAATMSTLTSSGAPANPQNPPPGGGQPPSVSGVPATPSAGPQVAPAGAAGASVGSAAPRTVPNAPITSMNGPNGKVDFSSFQQSPNLIPKGAGQSPNDAQRAMIPLYANQYKDQANQYTSDVSEANSNITRSRQILSLLQQPNVNLGPASPVVSKIQSLIQEFGNSPNVPNSAKDPTNYYLISKNVGTGAIQEFNQEMQASGGGSLRMGSQLSNLIMSQLSANPSLTKGAVQGMLQWIIANSTYDQQKSKDFSKATQLGNDGQVHGADPFSFDRTYEATYPRDQAFDKYVKNMSPDGYIKDSNGMYIGQSYRNKKTNEVGVYQGDGAFQN